MLRPSTETDTPPVSKTQQYKKITKPLLERKRRARMNRCYDDLKDLMTGCLHSEGENISKLEKADILELTLRHMKKLTEVKRSPVDELTQFRQGYTTCVQEATQFLVSLPGVDLRVGHRLVSHLMAGPPPPPPPPPLQRLDSPPPPPPPPAPPIQSFIQQRMLSNLIGLSPASISPGLLFQQQPSEPIKPLPVKPSAIRPGKPSPGGEVWKPYSN